MDSADRRGALAGRRIVVTRPHHQQAELAGALVAAGADVVGLPLIEIVELHDGVQFLRGELVGVDEVAWLVVSSPNGARTLAALCEEGCAMPPVAAIGESTARAIGHDVDFVSQRANAASFVEEFPPGDGRLIVVQGERADTTLADGLSAKGWRVTRCNVYQTVDTEPSAVDLAWAASADAIVFASGSAVENWVRLVGADFSGVIVVIGPVTKNVAESIGLRVDAMAAEPSIESLVTVLTTTLSP